MWVFFGEVSNWLPFCGHHLDLYLFEPSTVRQAWRQEPFSRIFCELASMSKRPGITCVYVANAKRIQPSSAMLFVVIFFAFQASARERGPEDVTKLLLQVWGAPLRSCGRRPCSGT